MAHIRLSIPEVTAEFAGLAYTDQGPTPVMVSVRMQNNKLRPVMVYARTGAAGMETYYQQDALSPDSKDDLTRLLGELQYLGGLLTS